MSKGRWSIEDFKKAGLIEVDNKFVPVKSQVQKGKVEKLKPLVITNRENLSEPFTGVNPTFCNNFNTINIKHLSTNKAWKGRRYKTNEHNIYCAAVSLLLPKHLIVPNGLLKVYYEFGVSSNGSDWDNGVKNFQDILSAKYHFNDNRIMEAHIKKVIVKKGSEFIRFRFESLRS